MFLSEANDRLGLLRNAPACLALTSRFILISPAFSLISLHLRMIVYVSLHHNMCSRRLRIHHFFTDSAQLRRKKLSLLVYLFHIPYANELW